MEQFLRDLRNLLDTYDAEIRISSDFKVWAGVHRGDDAKYARVTNWPASPVAEDLECDDNVTLVTWEAALLATIMNSTATRRYFDDEAGYEELLAKLRTACKVPA